MKFKDILNKYLEELGCTQKELSTESGISQTVISRYRKGERTPLKDSVQIKKISTAIVNMGKKKEINTYTKENILNEFNNAIDNQNSFNYDVLSNNLNTLITSLNINTNEMAKYIVFDPSHISRIRYKKARPSNPIHFSMKVCDFVCSKYKSSDDIKNLSKILDCDENSLNNENIFNTLFNWLTCENKEESNQVVEFLNNLDKFNLNDYIKAIKFDELKVPNIPFYKAKTKCYYGIEEMKQGELDFFKATVLSKSMEDIFMCTDMPMEDMGKDIEFGKKWMFAIAMSLKKGLHLNIIHNLDRPFNEMMLGLESWIPIYMTGQVSPFYFKNINNNIYHHLNYVSGNVALTGECIKGSHNKGMYYLTNKEKEVNYYREKSNLLLKKANSLMDIYREDNKKEYELFLQDDEKLLENRRRILSSLPLFTIHDKLLLEILERNNVAKKDIDNIIKYKNREKKYVENILKKNKISDYIYSINKSDFENEPVCLLLDNMFYRGQIFYTYDEYVKHLKQTKAYANKNNNYQINCNESKIFTNITITITDRSYVIISKNINPIIHFVIRHPKLISAIKDFNPLVKENINV